MITSQVADSAAAAYMAAGSTGDTSGSSSKSLPCTAELTAVKALADRLRASPAEVDRFVQHVEGIPPRVLLSWICLWDLRRRNL